MTNKIFNDINKKKIKYDDIKEFVNDINNAQPIYDKKRSGVERVHVVQIAAVVECPLDYVEDEMENLRDDLMPHVLAEELVLFKGAVGYSDDEPLTGFAFRIIVKEALTGAALMTIGTFLDENTKTVLREMDITTGIAKRPAQKGNT